MNASGDVMWAFVNSAELLHGRINDQAEHMLSKTKEELLV
jgi:hypothetical protein